MSSILTNEADNNKKQEDMRERQRAAEREFILKLEERAARTKTKLARLQRERKVLSTFATVLGMAQKLHDGVSILLLLFMAVGVLTYSTVFTAYLLYVMNNHLQRVLGYLEHAETPLDDDYGFKAFLFDVACLSAAQCAGRLAFLAADIVAFKLNFSSTFHSQNSELKARLERVDKELAEVEHQQELCSVAEAFRLMGVPQDEAKLILDFLPRYSRHADSRDERTRNVKAHRNCFA